MGACKCHEWFPVAEIGDWLSGSTVAYHGKVPSCAYRRSSGGVGGVADRQPDGAVTEVGD
jgi:hypothetical protein